MYKFLIAVVLFAAVNLTAGEYHVNTGKDNLVKFISDAPVEDFEGVTDKIDGYLLAAGIDKLEGANFYFEVDMNSVDTGIGLRNRHMREDYMHTEKYPYTHYKGEIIEASRQKDGSYKVKVEGVLFIHGVEKKRVIEGVISPSGSGLKVKSEFPVKLTDHDIKVPEFMFMKIDEEMQLVVEFHMKKV